MGDISSSIDIQNIGRDVIGIGVSGDGNIIGKDITIVINEAQSYGLTLLSASYFNEHNVG
jgi:hypothetical protein